MAESDLIRGNVDTVILKVLYEGDRYGYDLISQINARSGGQWEIKQPTVYACLKRLEKQGFVSSYWGSDSKGGRRKYYSLTKSGRDVFLEYKSEFERAHNLFDGLIFGPDITLKQSDDYSDVEEDGYSVPKRPASRRRVKKEAEPKEQPVPEPEKADGAEKAAEPETAGGYYQPFLFNEEEPKDDGSRILDEEPAPKPEPEQAKQTADPRSIIESYFASETGESYYDIHGSSAYRETVTERSEQLPAITKTTEPAPLPPTAVAEVKRAEPPSPAREAEAPAPARQEQPARPVAPLFEEEESPARREYKTVLSELVERFEFASPDIKKQPIRPEQVNEQAAVTEKADGPFYKIKQAALELGNEVNVRNHNDSAKQYTQKFYYYSNRLMLTHYMIMCAAMFILGVVLFCTFYFGMGMRVKFDNLLYIGAGLLPIVMFVVAVLAYAANVNRKKRINVNFRFSVIIRFVIMLQAAVIIYCLNVMWGMPVGFSSEYIPTLVIPAVYATFIPISEIIFMFLLKSESYAVE